MLKILITLFYVLHLYVTAYSINPEENTYSPAQLQLLLDSANIDFDNRQFKKGLAHAISAYELAKQLHDQQAILNAYVLMGRCYFEIGNLQSAQQSFQESEVMATDLKDTLNLIKCVSGQAKILSVQEQNLEALMLGYKAKELAKDFDQDIYYGIITNMAVSFRNSGQYENALDALLEANHYYEAKQMHHPLAIINNTLGELYRENLENFELAKKHYLKAISLNQKLGDDFQLSKNYNNLGLCFKLDHKIDSAFYYLDKAKSLKEAIGDIGGQAIVHYNFGELELESGNYQSAIQHYNKTLHISEQNGMTIGIYYAHQGLGRVYLVTGDYKQCLAYFKKARQASIPLNNPELKAEVLRAFFEYYKKTGEYALALQALETLQIHKDSVNHALRNQSFAEMKTMYEKQLSEKENLVLKAQQVQDQATIVYQQKIKNFYIALSILLLFTLLVLFLAYRQRKRMLLEAKVANHKLQQQNQQLEEQEEKLKGLNQMKDKIFSVLGHDMRAPLGSILTLIQLLEYDDIPADKKAEFLLRLRKETESTLSTLENILAWSRLQLQEKLSTKSTIDIEQLFAELEILYTSQASQKNVSLHFQAAKNSYLQGDINQIRSVITNLITNAIKFSNEGESNNVASMHTEGKFEIRVSDTGKGMSQDVLENLKNPKNRLTTPGTKGEKGTGIGLSLVKEFVALNGGELIFEPNYPKGTHAIVQFTPHTKTNNKAVDLTPE